MYMRAEARRAAELADLPVETPAAPAARDTRRLQLAAMAALWLLLAAATLVIGLQWGRHEATSATADLAAATPAAAPPPSAATPTRPASATTSTQIAAASTAPSAQAAAPPTVAAVAKEAPKTNAIAGPAAAAPTVTPVRRPTEARTAAVTPVSRSSARSAAAPSVRRPSARTSAVPPARLVITTTPPGAVVTVDGIGWGATPARIGFLPPGTKRVRVTKDGYASQERSIRVGDEGTARLNVVLRPIGR
jgi:hypothetical protein